MAHKAEPLPSNRPSHDAASTSSADSLRPPPKFDRSRVKTGPALLSAGVFDPLTTAPSLDVFWNQVDLHFQPLNLDDLNVLRSIQSNSRGGHCDEHLQIPSLGPRRAKDSQAHPRTESVSRRSNYGSKSIPGSRFRDAPSATENGSHPILSSLPESESNAHHNSVSAAPNASPSNNHASKVDANSAKNTSPSAFEQLDEATLHSCLNAFPVTQRLIAAFLDEGGAEGTPAPIPLSARSSRSTTVDEALGPGIGSIQQRYKHQAVLEQRVKAELADVGLFDRNEDDSLQSAMRLEQWRLRDVKASNRLRQKALLKNGVLPEVRNQAVRREAKRHDDKVEITYLERMISRLKKNKKSRSKFQKLLQRSFGHYKENERKLGTATAASAGAVPNGRAGAAREDRPSELRTKGKASASRKKKRKSDAGGGSNAKKLATSKNTGHGDHAGHH